MAKIRSTVKLISINTGYIGANKKGVSAMHHTIDQRECFWVQKVRLAPGRPTLSPDTPVVPYFSCRTCQKGPTASSSH